MVEKWGKNGQENNTYTRKSDNLLHRVIIFFYFSVSFCVFCGL
jgi:hypothetical protein